VNVEIDIEGKAKRQKEKEIDDKVKEPKVKAEVILK